MNLNILSLNLVIYVCVIFSCLGFYIITNLYKAGPLKPIKGKKSKEAKAKFQKRNQIYFISAVILSIILAVGLTLLISFLLSSDLPRGFILMCLPFTGSLCVLLLALIIKKKLRLLSLGALLVGTFFSLILINDYYRVFPTIGQVFGIIDAQQLDQSSVTIDYTVANNQNAYNNQSVQGSLDRAQNTNTSGTIYRIDIPGTVSHFNARPGYVYVPAIYKSSAQVHLPVMVLTEGVPGLPDNWIGLGMQNILDQFARTHEGITPLVFVVDDTGSIANDTECVNSPRGNAETYLTVDVPNYIKQSFRVDKSPHNWAMGGLSLGGMCSVMLTLRHPDVYNYFIDLGGETGPEVGPKDQTVATLFGGSEAEWEAHQPMLLMQRHSYPNIGGFFAAGNEDAFGITNGISQLSQASKKAKISSVTEIVNGAHTFNVWGQTFKDALPWVSNRIGATSCGSSCV